jgi:hypothetical protein
MPRSREAAEPCDRAASAQAVCGGTASGRLPRSAAAPPMSASAPNGTLTNAAMVTRRLRRLRSDGWTASRQTGVAGKRVQRRRDCVTASQRARCAHFRVLVELPLLAGSCPTPPQGSGRSRSQFSGLRRRSRSGCGLAAGDPAPMRITRRKTRDPMPLDSLESVLPHLGLLADHPSVASSLMKFRLARQVAWNSASS